MAASELPITASNVTTPSATTGAASGAAAQSSAGPRSATSINGAAATPGDVENGPSGNDEAGGFVAMLAEIMSADAATLAQAVVPPTAVAIDRTATEESSADSLDAEVDLQALLASAGLLRYAGATNSAELPQDSATAVASSRPESFNGVVQAKGVDVAIGALVQNPLGEIQDEAANTPQLRRNDAGEGKLTGDNALFANSIANALPTQTRVAIAERMTVHAHVGTPAWNDEVSAKLTYMVERGIQSASLQLSPEHLGPLEIRISVNNDQTSVWFGAAHAETRTALEQSLPRLRELFAGLGLNLSDAGVFRETPQQRAKQYPTDLAMRTDAREIAIAVVAPRGAIDAYA